MEQIKTRFAPSPTGRMHVGNLRTALYSWLIARHAGGRFVLRIEDTDQERLMEEAIDIIYRTMDETGLDADEGPRADGGCGPYVQSERCAQGIYQKYAQQLIDQGDAYYCFCDKERLASLQRIVAGKEVTTYDKHCLHLSKEEVAAKLAAGTPHVVRLNVPTEGTTCFHDEIYGDIEAPNEELDDMILIKSDGFPTYNFANVVDDHLMGITHVVRGNEYLSSTPKYNRLYEAFGWEIPTYIHCPLITNEDGEKLSKRSGHASFEDLIEQGFLKDAVLNYVALLGWSPAGEQEIFSLDELVEAFDYRRINKSPAVFDMTKLRWMNSEYFKAMDPSAFAEMARPLIREAIGDAFDADKVAAMVQTRIAVLPEIAEQIDFFPALPAYDNALYVHKKSKSTCESALEILRDARGLLADLAPFDNDAMFACLKEYADAHERKVNTVMWPLRVAVSGKAVTPAGATGIMEVLGKEESLRRIDSGIAQLEAQS